MKVALSLIYCCVIIHNLLIDYEVPDEWCDKRDLFADDAPEMLKVQTNDPSLQDIIDDETRREQLFLYLDSMGKF